MDASVDTSHPPDISLLLRVYGEQRWLLREVLPALREAERPGAVPSDDVAAALAYLEMLWSQADRLAKETDSAAAELDPRDLRCSVGLVEKAQRYHASIRRLRLGVETRIARLTAPLGDPVRHQHAGG
jgi:hypothetical protein